MTGVDHDTRPAIVKFVERMHRLSMEAPAPHQPCLPAEVTAVPHHPALRDRDRARLRAAARLALDRHPGPIGELIDREIQTFLDFGHRFDDGTGLARRLAAQLLAAGPRPESWGGTQDCGPSR